MNIEEFWKKSRTATRGEILRFAGVPADHADRLKFDDWSDLPPLAVAMLEHAWAHHSDTLCPVHKRYHSTDTAHA